MKPRQLNDTERELVKKEANEQFITAPRNEVLAISNRIIREHAEILKEIAKR